MTHRNGHFQIAPFDLPDQIVQVLFALGLENGFVKIKKGI
jgi:hypothetical protein